MKHLKLALALIAVTTFAVACTDTTNTNEASRTGTNATTPAATAPPATPTPDEFASARATYNASCIKCHKENGEGGLVELDEKTKLKVPSFKEGHALKHNDKEFTRQIAQGGDGMPAFKDRLSPEQIDGLVRFIRHELQAGLTTGGAPPAH